MRLECQNYSVSDGTVIRDKHGRFFLVSTSDTCTRISREEARTLLERHTSNYKVKHKFAYPPVGEQSINHLQFFESGKAFIRLGRDMLEQNWSDVFGLRIQNMLSTVSYNFIHGMELGLKAYILFSDQRLLPTDLKYYGHNIVLLLKAAKEHGLEIHRPIVIPCDEDEDPEILYRHTHEYWSVGIFGNATCHSEVRFDIAIGINLERYEQKGIEYPVSRVQNQEYYYIADIASLAYMLFDQMRQKDGFFDDDRRESHDEFNTWQEELHTQRRQHYLTEDEAVDIISEFYDDQLEDETSE